MILRKLSPTLTSYKLIFLACATNRASSDATAMRLTILINGSDPTVNHDYAVLWLDTDQQRWSREAHAGVDLPEWGELKCNGATTVLSGSTSTRPLCILHDLNVTRREEVNHADGIADMPPEISHMQVGWHWRLQAVDRAQVRAASALFADDVRAPRPRTQP
jgi:hypothetical protein